MSIYNTYHESKCQEFKDFSRFINTDLLIFCPFCGVKLEYERLVGLDIIIKDLTVKIPNFAPLMKEMAEHGHKVDAIRTIRDQAGCTLGEARQVLEKVVYQN